MIEEDLIFLPGAVIRVGRPDPLEVARDAYVHGRIDVDEFERRVAAALAAIR